MHVELRAPIRLKSHFVRGEAVGDWRELPPTFRRVRRFPGQGLWLGINDGDHWFLSVHRKMRGARFSYEWHNYPAHRFPFHGSDTLFVSVSVAHPTEHKWWAFSAGIWPPEHGRLARFLRRFPAKVYRR